MQEGPHNTVWFPLSRNFMGMWEPPGNEARTPISLSHLSCERLLQQLDGKPLCRLHTLSLSPAVEVLKNLQGKKERV